MLYWNHKVTIYNKNFYLNILKTLAMGKLGYDFEFWIYHRDKKDLKKNTV